MTPEQLKTALHGKLSTDMPSLLHDYLEGVFTDGDLEDKRKALYMGFEVLGMRSREKVENLPTVNVTFNGVNASISLDVEPAKEPEIIDIVPKVEGQPQVIESAAGSAAEDSGTDTLAAVRAQLDAFLASK